MINPNVIIDGAGTIWTIKATIPNESIWPIRIINAENAGHWNTKRIELIKLKKNWIKKSKNTIFTNVVISTFMFSGAFNTEHQLTDGVITTNNKIKKIHNTAIEA